MSSKELVDELITEANEGIALERAYKQEGRSDYDYTLSENPRLSELTRVYLSKKTIQELNEESARIIGLLESIRAEDDIKTIENALNSNLSFLLNSKRLRFYYNKNGFSIKNNLPSRDYNMNFCHNNEGYTCKLRISVKKETSNPGRVIDEVCNLMQDFVIKIGTTDLKKASERLNDWLEEDGNESIIRDFSIKLIELEHNTKK